ncbi:Leucine rich repeat [Leishmania braziliensis]|nr:Leucine rich repeat [Leishmania braziliensis]
MLSLRFLSVHMNSIKVLESGCLRTLRHLVELDLSANELREIPLGCWDGLGRLERLNLSSNRLTRLGPTAFGSLASLQWLSLGFNSISDVVGLRSVPAHAPLTYVDLCANRIATLDEVIDALTPHRAHLQELRLESPSSMTTAAVDGGAFSPSATTNASLNDSQGGVPDYWPIKENPCCLSPGSVMQGASGGRVEGSSCAASGQGNSRVSGAACSSPVTTGYVERLLSYFPRLLVVNGVSYGVDPLQALRQQRQSQEQEGLQGEEANAVGVTVAVADASPHALRCNADKSPQAGAERLDEDTPVSDAFARLLRKPLPHLRRSSSSSSRSQSSASFEEPKKQYRNRSHRRTSSRHRTRSLSHRRSRVTSSSSSSPQESPRHGHRAAVAPTSAPQAKQDPQAPPYSTGVPAPQKASEMDEESVVAAGAPGKKRAPLRHGQWAAAAKPRRASLRRRLSSNALSYATSPLSVTASFPSAVSPSTPQEHAPERKPQTSVSPSTTATPHMRKLRFEPTSVTPTTEASRTPSATPLTEQLMPSGGKSADLAALLGYPSPAGVTDTSDVSPPAATTHGQCEHRDGDGESGSKGLSVATTTDGGAVTPVTAKDWATHDLLSPLVGTASAVALRWKPKQVSRGTCTEQGTETLATVSCDAELAAKVEQLQAQLALRNTTISDLRRHLDLTRTQYVEGQREAQQRQQQLRSQVSALKDELARRSEEATILQRKQQAQLNRAVDFVKAEWGRRLEAAEQHSVEALAEAAGAWEERLARAAEENLHVQQTVTVKSAQLATLERQTHAMEAEMQAMRGSAVMQRRHGAARTELLLAEAEKRRSLEAAAATTAVQLCHSFCNATVRLHVEALREADRGRQWAEEALREQQAMWRTQVSAYEDAMRHAASEVHSAVMGKHGAAHLPPLPPTCKLPARPEAPPLSLAPVPSPTLTGVAAPQLELLELSGDSSDNKATCAQEDANEKDDKRARTQLRVERAAADDSALVSTPTTDSLREIQGEDSSRAAAAAAAACGAASDALRQVTGVDANDTLTRYWRNACARVEAQLHRVAAALHVATCTQQSMAAENTRLLSHVEALEGEKEALAALRSTSGVAVQERDNLLRTLHTLRADMEKKDAALDALEAEAHAKLNEKRHRIVELEDTVEALTVQQTRATEEHASMRGQLEAARAMVERLQQELADARERRRAMTQQQAEQVPDLERKQRELSELLATRNAESHQHQLEKKMLVHTLTIARQQLVRLYESHQHLSSEHASAKEQVTRLQTKLDAAQRQLHDVQEATLAKQKATLEVLSHLMTNNAL